MKSKSKQKNAGIILLAVGAAILLCVSVLVMFSDQIFPDTLPDTLYELEEEQIPLAAAPGASISIPGFESLTIPAEETDVRAYLYNPEANPCYFEISMVLSDGDEVIYTSKMISPGQTLYEITLLRGLEPGVYEAYLHYSTYSADDFSAMNGANVPFMLIVE